MDRLWHIKFYSMFPIQNSQIGAYFDNYEAAKSVMDKYTTLLTSKPQEEIEVIAFDDLMGHHCFRPDYFPYAVMFESGPELIAWKEIDEKLKASQRIAGLNKEVGFVSGEQKKEGE